MLTGPSFCVLGFDIALADSGYITSLDTKLRSYILYIGLVSILYILHICICHVCHPVICKTCQRQENLSVLQQYNGQLSIKYSFVYEIQYIIHLYRLSMVHFECII